MIIEQERDRPYRLLVSGGLFAFLAAVIMAHSGLLSFIDGVFVEVIQKHESGTKQAIMGAVSFLASPTLDIIWVLIIAFLLWGFKFKIPALWAIGTLIGGDVVATIAKDVVQRARPFGHLAADDGFSFPSGHVFGTTLIIAIIWIVVVPMIQTDWKCIVVRTVLILWMLLVAWSRVYLGAHYPSDTLGAMLLAYAWLQIAEWLYLWLAPKLAKIKFISHTVY
ncbi:membrane-associated phospholipid phosphatase [Secundilactobacillus odoratitofui DSM 19909 = JCM 15043]|uniref:Membrane-associated phospholipid phosphatase n=1 Tax=Secundilactobacillus odoratitofui DSM 19909 = JCM 15043 TaxID=1423776 RepID=A0A0R1LML6_9LACO|nr:phosphatase PAP2 family protein [Secundilactobacillus odoratitofui]KRK97085.1 membrane-associated phospholipid phosphatase [Secundilactobacillus odoratitofui DSM 19909 = JCM 15043]